MHHFRLCLDVMNLAVFLIFNFCKFIKHLQSADEFQIPPATQMRQRWLLL